ncbi:MAG: class IIb bacteriocin, lactobin A/cerein 7B family [Mycoplasmatota bacterium]|nr:class IIb bacteriocin, lactobin A/cerein 7B family [Mycoplasmatota bacterium]
MITIVRVEDEKLEKITGGAVEWLGIGVAIAAIIIFLSGVFEGYTNPGRCE